MAGGGNRGDDDMITDINVTPLVDIMLVLLIIFMLTANLIVAPAIKVDLPNAATGEGSEPSTIALTLTKDNKLYLNGKETTEEAVKAFVPGEIAKKADLQAIVAADQEVSHGQVVHLIDLVRTLGISKFALNIESLPGQ